MLQANIVPARFFCIFLFTLLSVSLFSCGQEEKGSLEVGDPAPGFTVTDLDGNRISLSDYRGSPVILRFFLTDCKFCRADTPVFNEYHERFGSRGLKVLYIDALRIDTHVLDAFRKELKIAFPVAQDGDGSVSKRYKVKALPQTIILDPEHTIIAAILGGVSEPELNGLLSRYFQ